MRYRHFVQTVYIITVLCRLSYTQANNLLKIGKLNEALEKYKQASEKSVVQGNRVKYESSKSQVQEKIEAINLEKAKQLNSDGINLYQVGKYSQAKKSFKEAISLCPAKYKTSLDSFENNLKYVRTEIKAMELKEQGDELSQRGKYHESIRKYEEARNISKVAEQRTKYQSNINLVQQKLNDLERLEINRQSAIRLNEEGIELYNKGKYEEAKEKFTQSCSKNLLNDNKNYYSTKYSTNLTVNSSKRYLEKAQIELDAIVLNKQGEDFFAEGKYLEAKEKYRAAYYKSEVLKERNIYRKHELQAQVEIEVDKIYQEAEKHFTDKLYYLAMSKYKEAIEKTIVKSQKEKYTKDLNDTQCEIDAKNLNQQGDNLFKQGKYEQALEKYSAAYTKASLKAKEYLNYSANKKKTQIEVDTINLILEGNKLLNEAQYVEAAEKYQTASNISNLQKDICIKKQKSTESKLGEQLKQMMDEGWIAENNDNPEEAERIFDDVLKIAKDGLKIAKNNTVCADYVKRAELKINGNRIFNEANDHIDGKTKLEQLRDIDKQYELAELQFTEGAKYDLNFKSGLSCVQECRAELQQKIDSIINLQFDYGVIDSHHHYTNAYLHEVELQGDLLINI